MTAPGSDAAPPVGAAPDAAPEGSANKIPWPLKVFGALLIGGGALSILGIVAWVLVLVGSYEGDAEGFKPVTVALLAAEIGVNLALAVLYLRLGLGLLRDRRRHGAGIARTIVTLLLASILLTVMTEGIVPGLARDAVLIVVMIVLQSYLDPALAEERELNRRLRKLEERSEEDERLERLRRYHGKAPYQLNFFNIFWTFVVCSFLGLVIEEVYHALVFGGYQDRAGLLFGPFSPIYGFGAVLMTVALNRVRDKNVVLVFLCSAVIGGAFEYFVSWFMQFAFGVTAWDYTGTFLSIDGRTNGFFMACWGVLGVVWVKWLQPRVFKLIYLIPWNWRYAVTGVAAVLIALDCVMTLQSLDYWFLRSSGQQPETAMQVFYAEHFGDDYMANRFQTMSMDVDSSARTQSQEL